MWTSKSTLATILIYLDKELHTTIDILAIPALETLVNSVDIGHNADLTLRTDSNI